MAMSKFPTALEVCTSVLGQFGLPIPSAIVGQSGDATATQLVYLLNYAGRKLVIETGRMAKPRPRHCRSSSSV